MSPGGYTTANIIIPLRTGSCGHALFCVSMVFKDSAPRPLGQGSNSRVCLNQFDKEAFVSESVENDVRLYVGDLRYDDRVRIGVEG